MSKRNWSRRGFLGAAGIAALAASGKVLGANDRLAIGVVGPGHHGSQLLKSFFALPAEANATVVAVCDTWDRNRARAVERVREATGQAPQAFRRLDEMLGKVKLDGLIIATPDHQHAQMLTASVKAGLDVYCEKPLATDLDEANRTLDAVRASKRIVQVGTQRRSNAFYIRAAELIRAGEIGPVMRIDIDWSMYSPYRWRRPDEVKALKESEVDWPAFLAGKPARPFDPRLYLEHVLFREFSSGIFDRWMTHAVDAVHMLTGARYPRSVVASGGTYAWKDYRENPDTVSAVLEYAEGFQFTFVTTFAHAGGNRSRVMGSKGFIDFEDAWQISGAGVQRKGDPPPPPPRPITATQEPPNHIQSHLLNWLRAMRSRQQPNSPIEAGHAHSVACLMATRAMWSGRRHVYDARERLIRDA
jgi:predicted dehydrogenase